MTLPNEPGPYSDPRHHLGDEIAVVHMLAMRAIERGRKYGWLAAGPPIANGPGLAEGPLSNRSTDEDLVASIRKIEAHLAASRFESRPLPMDVLQQVFELSSTEQRTLWCLVGFELDPGIRNLLRGVASEDNRGLTIGTLLSIVYNDTPHQGVSELGTESRMVEWCLVELDPADAAAPLSQRRIRIAERVLELASGIVRLAPAIKRMGKLPERTRGLEDLEIDGAARARVMRAIEESGSLVMVCGRVGSGRRSLLAAAAKHNGREVLEIDGRAISKQLSDARHEIRLLARECRLCGLIPLIRNLDALAGAGEVSDRLDLVDEIFAGLVLTTCAKPIARRWQQSPITVELPTLSSAQRAKLWANALPGANEADADVLATMYPLAPSLIHAASAAAVAHCGGAKMQPEHIEAGLRSVLDDRLAGLATRVDVTQKWEDLILPHDQITAIVELLARIRERRKVYEDWGFGEKVGRGLGVSALFSGPPGTGKTMAAGLIARDLSVELYQVDLSKISSKWIGETEKNLASLFDAAEAGHAILLFDEADALFGKRTEVRSSNDRHANQEVNYLLQRMESFTGICILTSNHDNAIDEAFRRRLSLHVRFPVPESKERRRLWHALLPTSAPVAKDLPLDQLAETYVMSGGYIRNAVLRAAFLAADEGTTIEAAHLVYAAQLEYESMGKIAPTLPGE
ncbi:MAG: AAA family ATPase [Kofleriaceae bacterium]